MSQTITPGTARSAAHPRPGTSVTHCEEPAEGCETDHVVPWAAGGPTTEANGLVAYAFHNRQRHRAPP